MSRKLIIYCFLPLLLLVLTGAAISQAEPKKNRQDSRNGTLQKMIVANGIVTMNVDLKRLDGTNPSVPLRFTVAPNSLFTVLVFNDQLRGPGPGSIALVPAPGLNAPGYSLPVPLTASLNQIVIEKLASGERFDLAVRDAKTGFTFFNIEGHDYDYDSKTRFLSIHGGRLLISPDFAGAIGRPSLADSAVGKISIAATMRLLEVTQIVNGQRESVVMPPLRGAAGPGAPTHTQGPDVIVGDLPDITVGGHDGSSVGLGIGTTSCNNGTQPIDWYALGNTHHPVIPQNLYRMSGGADNAEHFEQLGQSWLKHAFLALEDDQCGLGCNTSGCTPGNQLCAGCSDTYSSGLNASQSSLGSRAWVNPFTGSFPSGSADHSGHVHTGTSHRVTIKTSDLDPAQNSGATYFAEGQYVSPTEYTWCQSHPAECNMYNNVSYRRYNVSGNPPDFVFSPAAATVAMQPAIMAWTTTGATVRQVVPDPGNDGICFVGFRVTNPDPGVWHYEYAVYNENLDRAIQSFSVPLGCGISISNIGFHAPPQEPGWPNDGTAGNLGFSNSAWASNQTAGALTWNCETLAQNPNANAIRWGTLYNFRFDSDQPPQPANATVGFFKTGNPITVLIMAPMVCNPLQLTSVVSRKTHGAAGDFDVALPLGGSAGVECRSTSGNHTFVFTLTNNVVSGNAAVTTGTGTVSGSPAFSGNTMTVNLTGVTDQQQITVTISNVMDTFGQTLPDASVDAVILASDINSNRTVNAADVAQTKAQQGAPVDETNFRTDVNANGTINAADTALVKGSLGHSP